MTVERVIVGALAAAISAVVASMTGVDWSLVVGSLFGLGN